LTSLVAPHGAASLHATMLTLCAPLLTALGGPMKRILAAVAALAGSMIAMPVMSQAQTAVISGRITAETGEPIPAATVVVTALQLGATSDDQGNYTFAIPAQRLGSAPIVVMVRRIGYGSKTVSITPSAGSTTTVNFTLAALA